MLSLYFSQCKNDEYINIKEDVLKISRDIKIQNECNCILSLIFTKNINHRIKFLSFDYCWIIISEFKSVENALIKLSSIILAFKIYKFEDRCSICIINYIKYIYKLLIDNMIAIGCKKPPYKILATCSIKKILDIAYQIEENMLQ